MSALTPVPGPACSLLPSRRLTPSSVATGTNLSIWMVLRTAQPTGSTAAASTATASVRHTARPPVTASQIRTAAKAVASVGTVRRRRLKQTPVSAAWRPGWALSGMAVPATSPNSSRAAPRICG
jgi:hypothetical protein